MSCYLRNMGWMFRVLELDKDAGNRHRMDRAVRLTLGVEPEAPCSEVEAHLDALSVEERLDLIDRVGRELSV
ncbi:MAG: hypothetical protein ACYCXZ_08985 [Coriobacteriia bacterium]